MAAVENPMIRAGTTAADSKAAAGAPPERRKSMLDTFYTPEFQDMFRAAADDSGNDAGSVSSGSEASEDGSVDKDGAKIQETIENAVAKAAKAIRLAFVRKVMGIFLLQLLVTSGFAAAVITSPDINSWLISNPLVVLGAWGVCLVLLCLAVCSPSALRGSVACLAFLLVFTLAEGAVIGIMFVVIAANAVLIAVVATGAAVIGIFTLTLSETFGLSRCIMPMVSCLAAVAVFVTAGAIGGLVTVAGAFGGGFLAVLFCAFIASDVLAIVGGKHRCYQFSIDEPLLAATCLYVDVIGLFMYSISCAASAMSR